MVGTVKRVIEKFQADEMTDHAAALTYYVMMSLFPALLVGVALLGMLGDESLVKDAVDYARDNGAPPEVTNALRDSLTTTIQSAGGAVSVALVFGLALALYGASGAFGAAGRALNSVYGVQETRKFLVHKLIDLGCTLVVIFLAVVALFSVFLGGGLAKDLFETIGLGGMAAGIWRVARWLVAIGAVLSIYGVVFAFGPNIHPRRLRLLTAGALAGVVIWLLASAGFFFYVSNFGKYGATYGAFAGAVILLLWLYISSIAFLFGGELNAVREGVRSGARSDAPPLTAPSSVRHERPVSGDARVDEKYGRDALAGR